MLETVIPAWTALFRVRCYMCHVVSRARGAPGAGRGSRQFEFHYRDNVTYTLLCLSRCSFILISRRNTTWWGGGRLAVLGAWRKTCIPAHIRHRVSHRVRGTLLPLSPSEMSPSSAATSSCEHALGGADELPAPPVRPSDIAVAVSPVSSAMHFRSLVNQKVHRGALQSLAAAALAEDGNC
jgi:hypothetical protein